MKTLLRLICAPLLAMASTAFAQLTINGAGATFPYPIYSKWFDQYAKVDPAVRFNYQSIGSGGGIKQISGQTVDFGASDAPMSEEELGKAPGKLLHIPTVAGAVVVAYNLPGSPALQLDGPTLAAIFMGKVAKWNDPAIAALNAGVKLPDTDIVVVHRSDGSGTSFIFTSYLAAVSAEWKEKVGADKSVKWPAGLGAKGNEGVTGQVKQSPGSIGYVELAYARQNNLPFASLKNSNGEFVAASPASVTAALAAAQVPEDFRFSLVNVAGPGAYPLAGATWLLVYEQSKDAAKGAKMVEFLKWAMGDGQKLAEALDYAPLPAALQKRVLERVSQIK